MMTKKIVVCDDNKGVRTSIRVIVEDRFPEIEIIEIDHALKLHETFTSNPDISILFLDIHMPHVSGLDFIKDILNAYPNTKIIVITGVPDAETKSRAYYYGASDFIVKPWKSIDLIETITRNL
jgi:DNA-binding NtrC family response regulator